MTTNETAVDGKRTEPTQDIIMEVSNATVTFGMSRGESRVLDNVSLNIRREEILGIVGESGSGKSMYASALLDAIEDPGILTGDLTYYPTAGDPVDLLELSERELKSLRWEEISMVFQGAMSSFNPTKGIRGHFTETLAAHDYDVSEGMTHARELLSQLYLDPDRILDSYPHELSGGMKQRVLIALSLVLKPNMLVLDEPTAALDLLMQRSILSLLKNIQDRYDLTVVFITHDLPLVAGLADRLAVMYAFNFLEIGPADDIIENPAHPYTRSLLKAVPNLSTPLSEMHPIEGSAPDPVNVPAGCSYHPRCPLATDECRTETPPLFDVSADQRTACYHWEQSAEEIPLASANRLEEGSTPTQYVGTQSDEPVLTLNDLRVHFEKNKGLLNLFTEPETVRAVDGVDLEIYENDVVVLVGESGCGKTTLGKTAIGTQRPTGGSVEYRGQDIWAARDKRGDVDIPFEEIRRSLQIIHQHPDDALNPNKRVQHTLEKPLKRWHKELSQEDREARILGMLDHVGMTPPEDYANRYPHQLSGGEKQRVALIRSLLVNPDVILADEAVSALDVSLRVEMMDLMLELQDLFDTSYIFISHNLSNARYLAGKADGRIGVMYLGEIVEIGPAEEVITNPKHPYTKVLKWSTAELETNQKVEEPPIRGIDIPDPVDPPSGCRFHNRCPEAREVCRESSPTLEGGSDGEHSGACFREYGSDHTYWESDLLEKDAPSLDAFSE